MRGRLGQELFLGFVLPLMGNRHQNTSWKCSFTSIRLCWALQHPLPRLYPVSMNEDPLKKPQAFSRHSLLCGDSSELKWATQGHKHIWVSDHSFSLRWGKHQLGTFHRKRKFFMMMTFTWWWNEGAANYVLSIKIDSKNPNYAFPQKFSINWVFLHRSLPGPVILLVEWLV